MCLVGSYKLTKFKSAMLRIIFFKVIEDVTLSIKLGVSMFSLRSRSADCISNSID